MATKPSLLLHDVRFETALAAQDSFSNAAHKIPLNRYDPWDSHGRSTDPNRLPPGNKIDKGHERG
jgi:hypothetical protein